MASTTECVKVLGQEDLSKYAHLIDTNNGRNEWKRVNKFNYINGIRRYFYFTNSCLLATVDEVNGNLTPIVRPPMMWELYMLQNLRQNDDFVQGDATDIFDEHYDFCMQESSKYSEPEQYCFMMGDDDGGWVEFSPKLCDEYDQHLGGNLYDILPIGIRNEEVMECTYSPAYDSLKQELIDLGFEFVPLILTAK